jgi:TP901 family phage tail tape measure protein
VNIGDVFLKLLVDDKQFQADVRKAGDKAGWALGQRLSDGLTKAGRSLASTGKSLAQNVTLPIVALGAAVFKVGSEFDTTMRQIIALTDTTADEIGDVRESILGMAGDVGKTPQELAEGFYFLASAGFNTAEALEVLNSTAKAAATGLGTTADISRIVGAAINAFGKENLTATDAVDQLLRAVKNGTAEAPEFAGALGNVLGTAGQLGATFADTTAAIAAMTLKGIGADEAATSLNQIFVSLLKTTPAAADALGDVGLSAEGLREQLREKGLLSVLQTLSDRFAGNDEAAAAAFGNVRALRGILALTSGDAAQVAAVFDDVANGTQNVNDAFKQTEGPGRAFDRAMARIQVALIQLSADVLPVVADILEKVSGIISAVAGAFSSLPGPLRSSIVGVLAFAAAAGPVLFVTGKLMSGIGLLVGLFAKLRYAALLTGPAVAGFLQDISLGKQTGLAGVFAKAIAGMQAIGGAIASTLMKIPGMGAVRAAAVAAGSKLGGFMGSSLGKFAAVAFAAVAVVAMVETYNRIKGELGGQSEQIVADIAKQIAKGTTTQLEQSRAAVKAGLEKLEGVWDAGLFTGDTRKSLEAQMAALDAELARRAAGIPPTVGGALADGEGVVTAGGEEMLDGLDDTFEETEADARQAGLDTLSAYAEGLLAKRSAVDTAMESLGTAVENTMSRAAEVAKLIGLLTGEELAAGLAANDPVVIAQAEATRAIIEDRLRQLGVEAKSWGKDSADALAAGLASKDPAIRAQAERTNDIIEQEFANHSQHRDVGGAVVEGIAEGMESEGSTINDAARKLAKSLLDTFVTYLGSAAGRAEKQDNPLPLPKPGSFPTSTTTSGSGGSGLRTFAEGGFLPTGGTGWVGESGIEQIKSIPGGTLITPTQEGGASVTNLNLTFTGRIGDEKEDVVSALQRAASFSRG